MSFKNNMKWSGIGTVARYLFQSASIVVLSRILTAEDFGIVSSALIIITFLSVISQLGACQLIVTSEKNDLANAIFHSLIFCSSISIIFLIITVSYSNEISSFISNGEDISVYISFLAISLIPKSISVVFEGVLIRNSNFKFIAISNAISFILGYFLTATFLSMKDYGPWALIWANNIQAIIYMFMLIKKANVTKLMKSPTLDNIGSNLIKATYISYSQVLSNITSQIDNFIVSKYLGLTSLGIYTRSYQLMVVPCNFIGQTINRVFLFHFSNENESKSNDVLVKSLYSNFFVSVTVSLILFLYGEYIVRIILGEGWSAVSDPLLILCLSIYPRMLYKIAEPILISRHRTKLMALLSTLYSLLMLILVFLSIRDGLIGVSKAVLLATMIYGLISFYFVVKFDDNIKNRFVLISILYISFCFGAISYV